jgi:thioredoxin-like negative regulator of GroEL
LLKKLERTADRCSALEALAELEEGEARVATLREAARVALEELSDYQRAAARYRRLLVEVPHDTAAHDGLVTALTRARDLPALAEALLARARLLPGSRDERRDLAAAAQVYADELHDRERAIELWYQIRKSFGREQASFDALSMLLERTQRWEELATLLGEEAEAEQSKALYQRLGKLHREHTRDSARAYAAFSSAGDTVAAALTLTQSPALYTDSPAEPLALAESLAASGQSDLAEGVLRGQLGFYGASLPPARKTVHLALAMLLESLGQSERAVAELSTAANAYLSDLEVLSLLSKVAAKHGDWDRAEQSYRSLLLALHGSTPGESAPSRAEIYVALSDIKERRGDAPAAKELVESAFEVALENVGEALGLEVALRSRGKRDLLERALSERLGRPNELLSAAQALNELAGLRPRGEIAKDIEKRALAVAERLEQELRSEKDKPLVLAVCKALVSAYERLGAPERAVSLFETLETKLTKAQRAELEVDLLGCLVALPEKRAAARERLEKLVEKSGDHGRAFDLFCQVLSDEKDFAELVRILSRELAQREQAGDATVDELKLRIARANEQAGDVSSALEAYRAAAGDSPLGIEARAGVVRALEVLRPETSELADALEQLIESERAADRWEHTLRLLALRTQLGDEEGRERALKWAVAARPEPSELLDQLIAFHRQRGQHDKIIDVLEAAVRAAPGATAERIQLSGAYRSIGRPETALERLELVAEAEWTADFRRERFLVLEALGRADDALGVLRTLTGSAVEATPDVMLALSRLEQGGWSSDFALAASEFLATRDGSEARAVLDRYLTREPEHHGVLDRAAALAVASGDLEQALSLYERIARLSTGAERIGAVLETSKVARSLKRPEAALDALEAVFTADPDGSPAVRAELRALYRATEAHVKLGFLLMIEARSEKDPEKGAELLVEAASLLHAEGDEEAAETALARAHELDPASVDVAVLHAQVLAARGQREAAFASLAEFAKAPGKRRAKSLARVHRAVAELHLAEDELAEALPALLQAHQLERGDLELAMQLGLLAVDLDRHDLAASSLRLVTSAKTADGSPAVSGKILSVAYYHLACIEFLHGRKVGARRMVARALEEDPGNTDAERLSAELGQP